MRKKGAANAKNFVKRTKKKTKISFLGTNIVTAPLLGESLELVCCGFFFSLKIADISNSHRIKITDNLRNSYK